MYLVLYIYIYAKRHFDYSLFRSELNHSPPRLINLLPCLICDCGIVSDKIAYVLKQYDYMLII